MYLGTIYKTYENLYNAIKFFNKDEKMIAKREGIKVMPMQTKILNSGANFYENNFINITLIFPFYAKK
ncbi:hypothetical protein [Campylobacter concisus]|uniref:hypothetical protein n=1 Tax=Campylobacter concisus TaxID=199 RepID=UPI00112FB7D0|nr:hypothetical protein [Campylobacter concisus]QPH88919.1 hypothetical protein CVT15_09550 [Campylobacter concisus]QPI03834.1 hypothetical protein G5B95_09330 [Campylobacter concisus]